MDGLWRRAKSPGIVVSLLRVFVVAMTCWLSATMGDVCCAEEAQWIWSTEHDKGSVPQVSCHFRKTFSVTTPESGHILIASDDNYELYLNGRSIGSGGTAKKLDRYDISKQLGRGRNVIAIKVTNRTGSTAALVARVQVKSRGGEWKSYSTDDSWKANLRPLPLWNLPIYNDSLWKTVQAFGPLGSTAPWDRQEGVAVTTDATENPGSEEGLQQTHERFEISREFRLQRILGNESTGSLIAMTFNEFGQIIASREGGPLLLITDSNRDKVPDRVRVYCDKVKNCQGILSLNGDVYVTSDGPDGQALYRLSDKDRDGKLEDVTALVKFKGDMGEHGAHGIELGPDGMLYISVGNHTAPVREYETTSPHRNYYEGDLVGPRYEDPGGHAVGVKAPGGVILRTDIEGKSIQLVAGGLRNAFDLVFNREGELFTYDSDMESDLGTPWYRPTRIYHVTPGAEFGWRSGWAKWPDYFVDSLPGILDTGRGSPTGMTAYNHHMFPARYHNALFMGDWTEGRILVVRTKRSGGTYTANAEVFLKGDPLNVTDLSVGPDGALYFVTGGRGTSGGVYRVTWQGTVPESVKNVGEGISAVIRQPQLHSAWGRQQIASLKNKMGDQWNNNLVGVVASKANPPLYRTRALEIMQLFGPMPSPALLVQLSEDSNEEVRAKATEMMGLHADGHAHTRLLALLDDSNRTVRRKAMESLLRSGQSAPISKLTKSLTSDDRFEATAARRLLERQPLDKWQETVLTADNHRLFIQGALALMIAEKSKENALAVLERFNTVIGDKITDNDFIDMLRVMQVAMIRGEITAEDVPGLKANLAEEFPSGSPRMNRELVRLVTHLQVSSITDRYLEYLNSNVADLDKFHLAIHLRFIESGWSSGQRIQLLDYFDRARKRKGGGSYTHYVMNVTRDFAKSLAEEDSLLVLQRGDQWPDAALGALYKLPKELDGELFAMLKDLDKKILENKEDAAKRLRVGIVAVLARSADEASMAYLRDIWDRDPERRQAVAMGLAQQPDGENWDYLIRSLPIMEGGAARAVMAKLLSVDRQPKDPEAYRQAILLGLKLKEKGALHSVALLEFWTGEPLTGEEEAWEKSITAWQQWYHQNYPDRPVAKLPVAPAGNKWKFAELMQYLNGEKAVKASAHRGEAVFTKAQCIKCHRFGDKGEIAGPDLSTISKRFMKKEILESIVYPSHIVSDQYSSKTVFTTDGKQYSGIVAPGAIGEIVVLDSQGKKIPLSKDDIEETVRSKLSAMPAGLLNTLTLEEIADLFAYLQTSKNASIARRPDGVSP